jgi:hypothetical protein
LKLFEERSGPIATKNVDCIHWQMQLALKGRLLWIAIFLFYAGQAMGRKRHDTSRYGVSAAKSVKFQILGGALVVLAVVFGLLMINSITGGL